MAFKNRERWNVSNVLPVLFVISLIFTIWSVHFRYHLLRLLRSKEEHEHVLGLIETAISQLLTVLLLTCFLRAVNTDPGSVPETEDWKPESLPVKVNQWNGHTSRRASQSGKTSKAGEEAKLFNEVKHNGERRFCQKCSMHKPDRCHHCRVCNSCILRMDHHCPWIANCVGFKNHKFFFLLVFYAGANCWFVVMSMWPTVCRIAEHEMHPHERFAIVFGMTLSVIMACLLSVFFLFHSWLLTKAWTTIEFCEKRTAGPHGISYDLGLYENIRAVLGPNPLLWMLPLSLPLGDGLVFQTKEASLRAPLICDEKPEKEEPEKQVTGKQ